MRFDKQAEEILDLCRAKGLSLASVESCTGGLIGASLTEIPGSSDVVLGGFITYSNDAKMNLVGVNKASLEQFGAVSENVAAQMAEGGKAAIGADIVVSATGIAGPGGGSKEKPVGMVCFGLADATGAESFTKIFPDNGRHDIRQQSVAYALDLLKAAAERA